MICSVFFFFSSRRRHTRFDCDWSSDVCSSDLSQSAEDGSANLYFYRGSDNGATTDIYFAAVTRDGETRGPAVRSEEHTSELQSQTKLRCRLLAGKKKLASSPATGTKPAPGTPV